MTSSGARPEPNRLAGQGSPYLLQHADNPVAWYPWGREALERARLEDRPILLSIGYSSCHWCHVMERESFADEEVARLQNARFVNVKVDREERPDLDAIYMRAVQAMTGGGGWPLTVFLTPDARPFFGGTYFPPEPRHGMPSFRQVLDAVFRAWTEKRDQVEASAGEIHRMLAESAAAGASGETPGEGSEALPDLGRAASRLLSTFDRTHGGFGGAPKFPSSMLLEALLAMASIPDPEAMPDPEATTDPQSTAATLTPEARARPTPGASPLPPASELRNAAILTLRRMAAGGIRDALAGGFHRYATDARWLVPHFEKMLYDNALLARAYLQGWQHTGDPALRREVEDTLGWLETEMHAPEGGFFAALDADSEGEEGRFYVWSADEIRTVLGDDAPAFETAYGVLPSGNWEGVNILHHPDGRPFEPGPGPAPDLEAARRRLLAVRNRRERPFRDTKVLAAWNGMALRTFAEAGAVLDVPAWIDRAAHDLDALLRGPADGDQAVDGLRNAEGRLLHQRIEGRASVPAFLDDVAALGLAALALHEATLETRWLQEAIRLAEEVTNRFTDPGTDRLVDTPDDGEALIVRPRETQDNAVPSGNALAAELLFRLGRLLDRNDWAVRARRIVSGERRAIETAPRGFGRLLGLAVTMHAPPEEVAVMGDPADPRTRALLREVLRAPRPGRVFGGGSPSGTLAQLPLFRGRGPREGRPAAWVCRNYRCEAPVTEPEQLRALLRA